MTHRMILVSHDFKEVKAVVIARRKDASVAQQEEQWIRTPQTGVRGVTEAPLTEEGDADGD